MVFWRERPDLAHRLVRHREHLRRRGEARALEGGHEAIEDSLRGASRELLKNDRAHQRVESLRTARRLIRADLFDYPRHHRVGAAQMGDRGPRVMR